MNNPSQFIFHNVPGICALVTTCTAFFLVHQHCNYPSHSCACLAYYQPILHLLPQQSCENVSHSTSLPYCAMSPTSCRLRAQVLTEVYEDGCDLTHLISLCFCSHLLLLSSSYTSLDTGLSAVLQIGLTNSHPRAFSLGLPLNGVSSFVYTHDLLPLFFQVFYSNSSSYVRPFSGNPI